MEQRILFLHGFASSSRSTKARYLSRKLETVPRTAFYAMDFSPTPRDFEFMTTTGLIYRLRQYVLDHGLAPCSLIASSFGGLVATHYAHRFGGIERMLLLAPSLRWLSGGLSESEVARWQETGTASFFHPSFGRGLPLRYAAHIDGCQYLEPVPPAAPTLIIHGRHDAAVPIDDSREYAVRHANNIRLVEVDADHDLNGHLELVWEQVQLFLLDAQDGGS